MNAILKWIPLAGVCLLPGCRDDRHVDPCSGWSGVVAPDRSARVASSGPTMLMPVVSAATTPPSTVVTSPVSAQIAPGERATFVSVVTGFALQGCRDSVLTVGWTVSDTAVARVERDTGSRTVVLGRAPGRVSVIATVLQAPAVRAASLLEVVAPAAKSAAAK